MLKITILAFAFLTSFAHAERTGVVMGIGQSSCGEYVAWRTGGNQVSVIQATDWTFGFISAYNLYGSKSQIENPPTYATVGLYLEKYCRDYPLRTLTGGVLSLINELRDKR